MVSYVSQSPAIQAYYASWGHIFFTFCFIGLWASKLRYFLNKIGFFLYLLLYVFNLSCIGWWRMMTESMFKACLCNLARHCCNWGERIWKVTHWKELALPSIHEAVGYISITYFLKMWTIKLSVQQGRIYLELNCCMLSSDFHITEGGKLSPW